MRLLIDECLSEELAGLARERGHVEASHVAWMGKRGWKDWRLRSVILEGDWTFVTKNSADFRGPAEARGTRGQFADVPLHAGLICLNGPVGMDLDLQIALFSVALDELDNDDNLINQVLEVTLPDNAASEIEILRYKLPKEM